MKKFICFIVLLIILTGCSNNEKLTGNQAPDFEFSVLHSGQEINEPTPLDKKELIIEHIYWNEEHATTTNDDILNLLLNLENSNIHTLSCRVRSISYKF
ncbi:hypothetical protein Pryu01_01312 [Paraliobacillus ryukyuensis]|uniref:Uncharacterized protein n=1 Tax=Paraliobacillus ryukyuensis TaxID=200904 RepID=A0A366EAR4_9BACI|nr:membrane lipoprotein lipid attachment site-containing protein [Paraliobacillus ryukyuensis]RBO99456.1 hypothetical protein DES48_104129 [Paraliobacillus ryukyuensis]